LHGDVAVDLLPLLVEPRNKHAIFGGFSLSSTLLDSTLRSSCVMSLASFLALACFLGTLPVAGAAAIASAGSITFTSTAAAKILREGFWRKKRVACVPPAGGTAKMNGRMHKDARAVWPDANLT
jgi:hypothetical protein